MSDQKSSTEPLAYSDTAVRLFALASVVWGVVGMLVGVFIAAQLAGQRGLGAAAAAV